MELWIRSQNKQELAKAEHVGVYDNRVYINGYDENGYRIGEYKTKERALEVLDEIQNKITKFNLKTDYGCTDNIYEMPKD